MEVNAWNWELIGNLTIISLIIFILLIALTTVFVGSEFALVKIRATRIEQLADEGNKPAEL